MIGLNLIADTQLVSMRRTLDTVRDSPEQIEQDLEEEHFSDIERDTQTHIDIWSFQWLLCHFNGFVEVKRKRTFSASADPSRKSAVF